MGLAIAIIVTLALTYCIARHGLTSFVTLGCVGMAIYSIPGIIGLEMPFWVAASSQHFLLDAPTDSAWVLLTAWVAFISGTMLASARGARHSDFSPIVNDEARLSGIAAACALLAVLSYAYDASRGGVLFFLADRDDLATDGATLVSKWFVVIGLLSSLMLPGQRYTVFFLAMLGVKFLSGDRTMVAIATAASLVVLGHKYGGWRGLLSGRIVVSLGAAGAIVLFGKPIFISIKSFFGGTGLESGTSLEATLLSFEPIGIYSHLSYVMDTNLKISFFEFLESVLGNLLLVPSLFGVSTNLYNEMLQASFSFDVTYGVAGSYLAHGYAVGGVIGVILFYWVYAIGLVWCDWQFAKQSGLRKAMIACAGGVLAFYAHRNGMDNLGAFMRQIAFAGVIIAVVAGGIRALQPRRFPGPSQRAL